ncbi:cell division protein FtsH, partial [Thioclava sp. BHET1]
MELIDEEVRKIVDEGYATAKHILTEKAEDLRRLAEGLLEYETLTGPEIVRVMRGEPLGRDGDNDSSGPSSSLTSIPKTKPKPQSDGGAMEPEPSV